MSESVRPRALLPGDTPSRWSVWRTWLLKTLPGRAIVLGVAIKAITWPLGWVITRTTHDALIERLTMLQSDLFSIGAHGAHAF